jgi:hypoxanthine-guanine phosphoribosyltransferase
MKQQDVQHFVKYSDKYVAYVDDILHIIASGNSMQEVYSKLKEKKITDATITYIPPVDKSFSPLCQ